MTKVNKLSVFSFAKFQAVLLGLLGLIAGIAYSFGGFIVDSLVSLGWIATSETPGLSIGTVYAFGALLGMPLLFAASGYIAGIIQAILYNLFTRVFGGISLDFE